MVDQPTDTNASRLAGRAEWTQVVVGTPLTTRSDSVWTLRESEDQMDATELRAKQRPLKDAYREDPAKALVTSTAEGRCAADGIAIILNTAAGPVRAGLHPATGGDGSEACSGDILLQALVACAGVTLRSVATAMGVELRDAVVRATGTWDARGTLGVDRSVPVGLLAVDLRFALDTPADDATVSRLIDLTERYCVIAQTLAHPPTLTFGRADGVAG